MSDKSVRISHPSEVIIQNITSKGQYELEKGSLVNFIEESPTSSIAVITFQFKELSSFNCIQFDSMDKENEFMPNTFRFEISDDGKIWEPIIKEYEYSRVSKKQCKWNFSMLNSAYLKMVIRLNRRTREGNFRTAFSNFKVLIAGIEKIICSSENDRFWVKENIIDGRPDYGWSSKEKTAPGEEFLLVDLGSINRVEEIRILSKNAEETNFPETFYFYYSEDDLSWHQLHEEPQFMSEPGTWYKWKFFPTNIRFFKLLCVNNKPNSQKKYVSQIAEMEIYADADIITLSKKRIIAETPPYSSIMRPGLVRLAADGETKEGLVVQGNDRRLRDATTEFKGIVELATDGEDRELVVVQGNDKRLKHATENNYGLIRLAKKGESRPGLVVQSDDDRLKLATTDSPGIVELAEDGETRPGVVVQGNDKRLKKATVSEYGLVIMSELGADTPGKVLTADDPRLKKATTEKEGIVRFASNGEESAMSAVQGNDKRLKKATTELHGIVQLAQSGEDKEGVVVQGNDKRLKYASTENPGIIMLAKNGLNTPNKAVAADDERLFDAREAKPHTHDYAPIVHDYNSHSGLIHLQGSSSSEFKNINPPMPAHSVIYGKNEGKGGSGISGIGVDEGVIGFGDDNGVIGYSNGIDDDSAGVAGFSKKGFGGVFSSQKKYALYANGIGIKKKDIVGAGKAILAHGESDFYGNVRLIDANGNDCIVRYFKVTSDIVTKGDLVVLSDKEGSISKSRNAYSSKVVGVCVESASLELGEKKTGNEYAMIALFGVVNLHVDAADGSILPGDMLVSGLAAGYAVKADPNKLKPGMLVGKALAEWKRDKGIIPVILTLS
ncbi:MAG TPA: discoidin domain-containing protein [Leptospiraceae bacterium]|nr:discoidin domain-containing protein [Leptospiraceae bacterium]HNK55126.1 discoidin domain-containing protein [Leptospiraceae bacterium]HNK91486.1 discoidin domain-containing protein [Leptospiraceae bacterium]HNM87714.1 discoidin domain-containing protein [Leptospiraceae bacterium]HNN78005.1 discoidin domain-containing protein [Leptospiraceae bacterium]